jgi:hypothetical protein
MSGRSLLLAKNEVRRGARSHPNTFILFEHLERQIQMNGFDDWMLL